MKKEFRDGFYSEEFQKDFDKCQKLGEDLQTPCDPINVPPPEELKDFKPESVPWGTDELLKLAKERVNLENKIPPEEIVVETISKRDDTFESVPHNPELLKNDPYFSAILGVGQMEKTTDSLGKVVEKKYKEILRGEIPKNDEKIKLAAKFKELSSTEEFKRIHELSVRVNLEEKKKIESQAHKFGFKNTSDYIRFVTLNAVLFAGIDISKKD